MFVLPMQELMGDPCHNYNVRPLVAEIAVNKKTYRIIRPRQKLKDLIK